MRCLLGADGDVVETLIDGILGTDSPTPLYCLCHTAGDLRLHGQNTDLVDLDLCLPAKRPGCGERCLPLARLRMPLLATMAFLCDGDHLSAARMHEFLNRYFTAKIFRPVLELVTTIDSPAFDFRGLLSWHRTKVISTIKKLVRPIPSVNWLIATFGTWEAEFILTTTEYFFSAVPCSRETLQHLATLFIGDTRGRSLVSVGSFFDLCLLVGRSPWQANVPHFGEFLTAKLEADDREIVALDGVLDRFRGTLFMSKQDTLRFLYIGFFQCLNRITFEKYTRATDSLEKVRCHLEKLKAGKGSEILSAALDADFKQRMETYYNKTDFLAQHTRCYSLVASASALQGYSLSKSTGMRAWSGQHRDLVSFLETVSDNFPFLGLTRDLSGLLALAALPRDYRELHQAGPTPSQIAPGDQCAQDMFLSAVGRFPVFRTEFNGGHYFSLMIEDALESHWLKTIHVAGEAIGAFLDRQEQELSSDNFIFPKYHSTASATGLIEDERSSGSLLKTVDEELLTQLIFYDEPPQITDIRQQLLVSRHEFFNSRLPVFNLVLDFDLDHIAETRMPTLSRLLRLCHLLRDEVLDALELLGPVDRRTHYVLFFKSTCPPLPPDVQNTDGLFCTCQEKLGLRIITRLPPGRVLAGTDCVIGIVKVINRLIRLNAEICKLYPQIKKDSGPLDVGIYHSGRSIRLPNTFKVTATAARVSKQLRILVVLPPEGSFIEYLRRCVTLSYLLHHGTPQPDEKEKELEVFFRVVDTSEDFLEQKSIEHLPRPCEDIPARIEAVRGHNVLVWITECAWPAVFRSMRQHLQNDKTVQFQNVNFELGGRNIVILKPRKGRYFSCLNYQHKNKAQTVRFFLALHSTNSNTITVTLMSQCFSSKCNNNRSTPHFSIVQELSSTEESTVVAEGPDLV